MTGVRLVRWAVLSVCLWARALPAEDLTPLDEYVHQNDAVYGWKVVSEHPADDQTTFVLELTSQTWRPAEELSPSVWKHWLVVVVPKEVVSSTGFLYISGGSNDDPPPTAAGDLVRSIALATHTVVAELLMVPNQPTTYADSPDEHRYEDDLVAYSRLKYFETKDPFKLVRLAMVKSGVRAMDAVTEFMATEQAGQKTVDRFVVAGGSKRGWTTWLVGAVDDRVSAIIPIVIDALNSQAIARHHFEAYGFFSAALDDYVRHGLFPGKIGTPEYAEVLRIEDPFNYRHRERLKMPKLMINATGDQFFLPDGWQFYYGELPEEKHIRYVPNARHNLGGTDAIETVIAFHQMIVTGEKRPAFRWSIDRKGKYELWFDGPLPKELSIWQAHNSQSRDFRLDAVGPVFHKTRTVPIHEKIELHPFQGYLERPEEGYTAWFFELVWETKSGMTFKETTGVRVLPDVYLYDFKDSATPQAEDVLRAKK